MRVMSFALEFRKKHFTAPTAKVAGRPKRSRSKRRKAEDGRAETQGAKATMLGALVVMAAILAIFNCEGLWLYAGDLVESQIGRPMLALWETWDGAMQRGRQECGGTRARFRDWLARGALDRFGKRFWGCSRGRS